MCPKLGLADFTCHFSGKVSVRHEIQVLVTDYFILYFIRTDSVYMVLQHVDRLVVL